MSYERNSNQPFCFFYILFLFIGVSCERNAKDINTINSNKNSLHYYYFGDEYVISGILLVQEQYGAPNYGETPDIDELEKVYFVVIDTAINIVVKDTVNTHNLENKYSQSYF